MADAPRIDEVMTFSLPCLFLQFMLVERIGSSGHTLPPRRGWALLCMTGLCVSGAASAQCPLLPVPLLQPPALLDMSDLDILAAPAALVLTRFLTCWSHRLQQRLDVLSRLGHQLHHAVPRVDVASATMLHPIDLFAQVAMTVLAGSLLGATANAAAVAGLLNFVVAPFQHFNERTPHWLGYLVQQPEAHVLHHESGVHARNCGDLSAWDTLSGTFESPRDRAALAAVHVGFEQEAARRVDAMLMYMDANRGQGRSRT